MLSDILRPGDKVELQSIKHVRNDDDPAGKRVYFSQVHEVQSDDHIEILMPLEKTKLILLSVDAEYDLYFYTSSGLYQCFARIVDRYKSDNIYILMLELTSSLRKNQRREFYRFGCALEMNIRYLTEQECMQKQTYILDDLLPYQKCIVVDISGGGLRFVSRQKYEEGSLVACKFLLLTDKGAKEYSPVGRVLSTKESASKSDVYEHRVQYVSIGVEEREEIIRYIFQEERKQRRKESGKKD